MSASNTMCRKCEHDAGRVWLDLTWRPVLVTARIAGQRSMVAMLMMCWIYVEFLVQLQGGSLHLGWCSSFNAARAKVPSICSAVPQHCGFVSLQ
jgi:hypothetical protein